MAEFVPSPRGEAATPVTPRESLEGHLVAFAAMESSRSGKPVELPR